MCAELTVAKLDCFRSVCTYNIIDAPDKVYSVKSLFLALFMSQSWMAILLSFEFCPFESKLPIQICINTVHTQVNVRSLGQSDEEEMYREYASLGLIR